MALASLATPYLSMLAIVKLPYYSCLIELGRFTPVLSLNLGVSQYQRVKYPSVPGSESRSIRKHVHNDYYL